MAETKAERNARLKAMRQKYGLGEFKKKGIRFKRKRGVRMARRKYSRKGSNGFGGLISTKNILGTVAGAYIAPKMGVSPQIGAAAGSYLIGKKGVMGAAVGYFAAPYLLGLLGGAVGGTASNSDAW